jgi:hypothetical protein
MDYISINQLSEFIKLVPGTNFDQIIHVVLVGSYDISNNNHELGLVSDMIDSIVSKNLNIRLNIIMIDPVYSYKNSRKFLEKNYCWLEQEKDQYCLIDKENISIKIITSCFDQDQNMTSILEHIRINIKEVFIYQNFTGHNCMIQGLTYDKYLKDNDLFDRVIINTNRILNSCTLDMNLDMNKLIFNEKDRRLIFYNIYSLSFFDINKHNYNDNNLLLNYKIFVTFILISMLVDAIHKVKVESKLTRDFCKSNMNINIFSLIFEDYHNIYLDTFIDKYIRILITSIMDVFGCLLDDQELIDAYVEIIKVLITSKDFYNLHSYVKGVICDSMMNKQHLSLLNNNI